MLYISSNSNNNDNNNNNNNDNNNNESIKSYHVSSHNDNAASASCRSQYCIVMFLVTMS